MIMKSVTSLLNSIRHTVVHVVVKILQKILQKLALARLLLHCEHSSDNPGNTNKATFPRNEYSETSVPSGHTMKLKQYTSWLGRLATQSMWG